MITQAETLRIDVQHDGIQHCLFRYTYHTGETQEQLSFLQPGVDAAAYRDSLIAGIEAAKAESEFAGVLG